MAVTQTLEQKLTAGFELGLPKPEVPMCIYDNLNTAFSMEGAYIHIPKNTEVQKPIQIKCCIG